MDSIVTVITLPAATRLATLEALKAELSIPASDPTSDVALEGLLDQASAATARWCGLAMARQTLREAFRLWRPLEVLVLSCGPVAAITAVTEAGTAVAAENWEADLASGLLWRLSAGERCRWIATGIVVDYAAGWLLPGQDGRDLPPEIERACILAAAAMWHARGRDPLLRSEAVEGVGSTSFLDPRGGMEGLPPQAAGLLAPWRRISFA
jgi:uncharacterized phiE125 gp8 family phage protein